MEFANPAALWLLLLLIPLILFTRNSLCELPRWRFILSLMLRIIIFLLIIGAIAEMQEIKPNDKLCVIYAVDVSKSITEENMEEVKAFIKKSLEEMPEGDEAGLVVFGGNSFVEFIPSKNPSVLDFTSVVDRGHTDLSAALRLSLAMFPADANKRIVLFSDGMENRGDVLSEALLVVSNSVSVDSVPLDSSLEKEVFLSEFNIPEVVRIDEPFEAEITLKSTQASTVKLQFYRDSRLMGEEELSIKEGKNVFFIPQEVERGGFYSYEIKLIADNDCDTLVDNNSGFAYTKAYGKPRVLLLEGEKSEGKFLLEALTHEGMWVDLASYDKIPSNLAEIQNYSCIIFSDIPSLKLSHDQMTFIESYVRDLGGGFIMIGGENSFGVGGYYNTPIEETLPVSMDIRKDRHLPTMALVLAIDKSGSMSAFGEGGVEKMALAREAAIACVELLSPSDQIGVIGFDDAAKWVTPFQKRTDNKDSIIRDIASMRSGGGTNAYPALEEAERVLSKTEALLKHIILLSDGRTAPADFKALVQRLNSYNITLSCVGTGQDADIPFLQELADMGGGRFYHTTDASLLPRIFTKEALLASRAAIVEEEFYPVINSYGKILGGIDWDEVPPLGGYVVSTPKERAEVLLVATEEEDPLLARWNYGTGKSIAFTSDAKSRWACEWIKWKSFPSFWAQSVRWAMRGEENPLVDMSVSLEEEKGKITVDAVSPGGEFMNLLDLEAIVIYPDLTAEKVPLKQEGPGRYEAFFPCNDVGTYFVNAGGKETGYESAGFSYSISPEYKSAGINSFLLGRLVQETGGRLLGFNGYGRVFDHPLKKSFQVKELWPLLILWALLLFPLDIAVRRVFLPQNWKEDLIKYFFREKREKEEPAADFSRLKVRKLKVVEDRNEKISGLLAVKGSLDKGRKSKIIHGEEPVAKIEKVEEVKEKTPEKSLDSLARLKKAKREIRSKQVDGTGL